MKKRFRILAMLTALTMFAAGCSSKTPTPSTPPASDAPTESSAPEKIDYPTKTIQIIVPVKPGGGTDLSCRLILPYLEKELGQSLVVVNVDGAGGSLGTTQVKDSAPDGYTVLYHQSDIIANDIMGVVDYHWDEAFAVAGTVNQINNMALLVAGDAPYDSLEEFIAYAKEQDKPLNLATEIGTDISTAFPRCRRYVTEWRRSRKRRMESWISRWTSMAGSIRPWQRSWRKSWIDIT